MPRTIALRPPAPRGASRFHPAPVVWSRRGGEIRHQIRFENPRGGIADDHDAPRQRPRQGRRRFDGADAEAFFAVGKTDSIDPVGRVRGQMRTAIAVVQRRLRDQQPLARGRFEERRKRPAVRAGCGRAGRDLRKRSSYAGPYLPAGCSASASRWSPPAHENLSAPRRPSSTRRRVPETESESRRHRRAPSE